MIDPLTLDQMRVFVAVAEAGSFRAAAQRLRRVQSAVSHALASLETQLGVRLFDRSGRRPVLTAEGQTLLGDARALLLKADVLRARARGLGQKVELKLTVALDPQFPLPLAAAALKAVHQTYPTVGVQTWTLPLGSALAALHSRQCALAVTGADIADPTIELSFLADVPRAALAAPDHPLAQLAAGAQPLTRIAFADHVQIVVPDPSPLTEGQDFGVLSPGVWRASDNETKRALLIAGVGWGSLPLWLVADDLDAGRLVRLPVEEFGPDGVTVTPSWLGWRIDAPPGPAGRLFCDELKRRCAKLRGGAAAQTFRPLNSRELQD